MLDQTLVTLVLIALYSEDFFTLRVLMVYTQGHPGERDPPGSFIKQLGFVPVCTTVLMSRVLWTAVIN